MIVNSQKRDGGSLMAESRIKEEYIDDILDVLKKSNVDLDLAKPEEGEDYYCRVECEVMVGGSGRVFAVLDPEDITHEFPDECSISDIVWDDIDVIHIEPVPNARKQKFNFKGEPFNEAEWKIKNSKNIIITLSDNNIPTKPYWFKLDKSQTLLDRWVVSK